MTKNEMVKELTQRGYYRAQAKLVLDDILDILGSTLAEKHNITIRGFGTFEVRVRKGKRIRNINTGELDTTSDTNIIVFRPGESLRVALETGVYDPAIEGDDGADKPKRGRPKKNKDAEVAGNSETESTEN